MYFLIEILTKAEESYNKICVTDDYNCYGDWSFKLQDEQTKEELVVGYPELLDLYKSGKLIGVVDIAPYTPSYCHILSKRARQLSDEVKPPHYIYLESSPVKYLENIYNGLFKLNLEHVDYSNKDYATVVSYFTSDKKVLLIISTGNTISPIETTNYFYHLKGELIEWVDLYKYLVGVDVSEADLIYVRFGNLLFQLEVTPKIKQYITKIAVLRR